MDITYNLEDMGDSFMYVAHDNDESVGYVKVSRGGGTLVIESTVVDNRYRGKGIAAELIALVVEYAKDKHAKIKPVCSYAKALFERNDEYRKLEG